jgi:hypothetical protein
MRSCKSLLVGGGGGSARAHGSDRLSHRARCEPRESADFQSASGVARRRAASGHLFVQCRGWDRSMSWSCRNSAGTKQLYMGFTTTVGRPAGMTILCRAHELAG